MSRPMKRRYVYDGVQRLLHWWLALCVLALVVTGLIASSMEAESSRSDLWLLHMIIGNLLVVGLIGRLLWGVIGGEHARWLAFWHPRAWIDSVRRRVYLSADRDFGHHEQASVSYLGFYGLVVFMATTGLLLAAMLHGFGPLTPWFSDSLTWAHTLQELHEYGWWLVGGFVVTHIAALIYHEWHDQIPIAQSMISGFQYRTAKEVAHEDRS